MRDLTIAGFVLGVATSVANGQGCGGWTTTILSPAGQGDSYVRCVGSVFQGGFRNVSGVGDRPLAWSGSSESVVYFDAVQSQTGIVFATFGSSLGGSDGASRPCLWRGPAFEFLSLAARGGAVYGMTAEVQVGFVSQPSGYDGATIWRGSSASARLLPFPPGGGWASSTALAVAGNIAVGFGRDNSNWTKAVMWSTAPDATEAVVLHPPGATASYAAATDGSRQGGYVFDGTRSRAVLWTGSAESVDALGPSGVNSSVTGMSFGVQVGYVANRAILWRGTPESAEDITPGWAQSASPAGVWSDGDRLQVVGSCTSWFGQTYAVLWNFESPRACCPADLNGDGVVDADDLGAMLAQWGFVAPNTLGDLNDDWAVNGADVGQLLAAWGSCTN
jgi:hypothetical protein